MMKKQRAIQSTENNTNNNNDNSQRNNKSSYNKKNHNKQIYIQINKLALKTK